jgi:hypothetical protein
VKSFYNKHYLCPAHSQHGEIAAVCQRCYSLAIAQQRRQVEAERDRAHEAYLGLKKAA